MEFACKKIEDIESSSFTFRYLFVDPSVGGGEMSRVSRMVVRGGGGKNIARETNDCNTLL